jgi:hypothetical protein
MSETLALLQTFSITIAVPAVVIGTIAILKTLNFKE